VGVGIGVGVGVGEGLAVGVWVRVWVGLGVAVIGTTRSISVMASGWAVEQAARISITRVTAMGLMFILPR